LWFNKQSTFPQCARQLWLPIAVINITSFAEWTLTWGRWTLDRPWPTHQTRQVWQAYRSKFPPIQLSTITITLNKTLKRQIFVHINLLNNRMYKIVNSRLINEIMIFFITQIAMLDLLFFGSRLNCTTTTLGDSHLFYIFFFSFC
jgi:hypothetical protein